VVNYEALRNKLHELDPVTWGRIEFAAEAGDSEAQFLLGSCIEDVRLERDDCEKWLRAAAAQNHPAALHHLACTTFRPQVVTVTCPGTEEGRQLLTRAAERGSVNAQRDLAVSFIWGDHPFEKDRSKARFWYLKAARQGHQESQATVGSMLVRGDGRPVNQEEGLPLLELAANGPTSYEGQTATEELPVYYSGAFGVQPDSEKENYWREKAKCYKANELL